MFSIGRKREASGVPFVSEEDGLIAVSVDLEPYMAEAIADALERDGCEGEAYYFRDAARDCKIRRGSVA